MRKVLLITDDFPPVIGGLARWYERVCTAVPPDRVVVLTPQVPEAHRFDVRQRYRIVRRRVPRGTHPLGRLLQIALLVIYAARIARRERAQVIHIAHLHLGLIGIALKRWLGTPYVLYLHGGEMAPYMRFRLVRTVARAIVREACLMVVNSTFTRRHFEALGMSNSHVELLTMSVETDRFRPDLDVQETRVKYHLDGKRTILTVGRLVERKGHDMIIRALRSVQERAGPTVYVIAGTGPQEEKLRKLAVDVGCEGDVVFAGYVAEDQLPLLYAACDVFAMPSRALNTRDGVEGFGIVFLEAGACGKPVVGGRSGGIANAVADGVTGLLVDPVDVNDVTDALVRLLVQREVARQLGASGRRRAESLKSAWEDAVQRIWNLPSVG
ncbi:MAG TPA: glycosyltransferase family 4 protein [bacterium]|nr:glycosyltransferase family 4 protein [bacterium]